MAFLKSFLLAALVAAASVNAQSANPGLGSNPKAQGATANVTTSTGPNGYEENAIEDLVQSLIKKQI